LNIHREVAVNSTPVNDSFPYYPEGGDIDFQSLGVYDLSHLKIKWLSFRDSSLGLLVSPQNTCLLWYLITLV